MTLNNGAVSDETRAFVPSASSPSVSPVPASIPSAFDLPRPMAAAPTDRPILAWCNEECSNDRCGYHTGEGTSLCLFHGHAEGLSSTGTGWRIVEWGGSWDESTWENPNAAWMPDWWFRSGSEFEEAANPVVWFPLPDTPAEAIEARSDETQGGSAVGESVVAESDAPKSPPISSKEGTDAF